ncbi:MAG: sugar ABC transporter ATP-binding protein [Labilithrix sp.]|nr:sugar ABC transporter ATP-binding protein [Labilithrix sp.]MCW5816728.1 sugar ABC transporter ATP-binding protein [Labilithrix sp.]
MAERVTVLEIAGIEKSFGAVSVLKGVTLPVAAGETHALLGENGAGKSTLMRILLGAEHADKGTMTLAGQPYAPRSPLAARAAGVVMVPQERTLCPHLTVLENVMLGLEPTTAGFVRRADARAAAEKALGLVTGVGRRIPLDARAGVLPVADQQLVEIARALAQSAETGGAKVLVLDEPTSSLGHDDAARLFTRVDALKAQGLAILLVTHFLDDVRTRSDRYTVLRDGKVQGEGDPKTTPPETIVRQMLGRELEAERAHEASAPGDVLLEAKDLAGKQKPKRATFTLRRGEVFGIAGLVGSGRTELLRLLAGLDPLADGDVDTGARIGLLSEDRGGEGLMLDRTIADNVNLSPRSPFVAWPPAELAEGRRWIDTLSIRASGPAQRTGDLSGGNQQKVQIARLLREDHDVLLFDEPTRGIDVASKAQVLALVRELAAKGKAIVLVSSQLDELVSTCDRIAVLRRGELDPARPAAEWTEAKLLLEAST